MRFALLLALFLPVIGHASVKDQLIEMISAGRYQEARELVSRQSEADLKGELLASPELNYNLGYLYWQVEVPGKAISYWLKYLRHSRSPEAMWTVLNQIRAIETESAIPGSVGKSFWFPFFLVANPYYIFLLGNVVLWATVFWLVFARYFPKRVISRRAFASVALLCAASAATLYAIDVKRPRIAVVDKDKDTVGVYKNSQLSTDGQLVEIPSGTIVILGREKEKSIEILSPFSGWVNRTEILESI